MNFNFEEIVKELKFYRPVVTTYKGKQYNPVRRRLDEVTVLYPVCGCCGNPVHPSMDKTWCRWCGNNIDWTVLPTMEYGKAVRVSTKLSHFKNLRRIGEN